MGPQTHIQERELAMLVLLGDGLSEMGKRPQNYRLRFEPAEGYFKAHRLQL